MQKFLLTQGALLTQPYHLLDTLYYWNIRVSFKTLYRPDILIQTLGHFQPSTSKEITLKQLFEFYIRLKVPTRVQNHYEYHLNVVNL